MEEPKDSNKQDVNSEKEETLTDEPKVENTEAETV